MEEKKYTSTGSIIAAIAIYCVILFGIAGFIIIFLGLIFAKKYDLDMGVVLQGFTQSDLSNFDDAYIKVYALSQGWGNLIGYFLATAIVVFLMRRDLKIDFQEMKNNKSFYFKFIIISAILFVVFTYIVDIICGLLVPSSENQQTIENIITKGGAIPMIIAIVFFAPVVEELIYRKAIFSLTKKYHVALGYFFSILFFTIPHMLSSDMSNIFVWILQCIPYVASGALLCLIYHKSKFNIYASIAAHMANNLLAAVLMVISMLYGG